MSIKAGVGFSAKKKTKAALKEAMDQAFEKSGVKKPNAIIVYATVGHSHDQLPSMIREEFPAVEIVGCSSEGVLTQGIADESNFGLGIMAIESDCMEFETVGVDAVGSDYAEAGRKLAEQINKTRVKNPKFAVIFPEGLQCNFDAFMRGYEKTIKLKDLQLFGGLAADNFSMKSTFQYHNEKTYSTGISCMIVGGEIETSWSVSHGCLPIGDKRTVTKSDKNNIYEIDNKPIFNVLKEYLTDAEIDDWAKTVVGLCIGFPLPKNLNLSEIEKRHNQYLIRFIPSKDDKAGCITIPTEVAEGQEIWMTTRDEKQLVENCIESINTMIDRSGKPDIVLQFECGGRGKYIMSEDRKLDYIQRVQKKFGTEVPWLGFYTFGEFAPIAGKNFFHNYTGVLLGIKEKKKAA